MTTREELRELADRGRRLLDAYEANNADENWQAYQAVRLEMIQAFDLRTELALLDLVEQLRAALVAADGFLDLSRPPFSDALAAVESFGVPEETRNEP